MPSPHLTHSQAVRHREAITTHGMCGTPTYRSWVSMLQRCTNPNTSGYALYGGRGIQVCDQWRDFSVFYFDMGERPDGTTLDRINPNGDYSPGNCRWATPASQSNNRRNNHVVKYNGITASVTELCRTINVDVELVRSRMNHLGWDFATAVETPVDKCRDRIDITGQRFGMLLAVEYHSTNNRRAMWFCRCDCGRDYIGEGRYLRNGRVKSCGCKRGRPQNP